MTETSKQNLTGVSETLLITLYLRAMESQRQDALIKDEKAAAMVAQMSYDFSRIKRIRMGERHKVTIILRNREFDRCVRDFLTRNPDSVVISLGCGLDSRFERVDNGRVIWYDLDLPEVIELRRKFIGGEIERYHWLPYSAFDPAWLEIVGVHQPRPFLFLGEGVLMYFKEEQVKSLILRLHERFPGAELVFDAFSPYLIRVSNLRFALARYSARYHWGIKKGKDLEKWGTGILLLDEWFPFDHPETRLADVSWMRHMPLFAKVMGIFRYRLGETVQ
jgi:O-methyltransferase involved in polyketide biosynthesis